MKKIVIMLLVAMLCTGCTNGELIVYRQNWEILPPNINNCKRSIIPSRPITKN